MIRPFVDDFARNAGVYTVCLEKTLGTRILLCFLTLPLVTAFELLSAIRMTDTSQLLVLFRKVISLPISALLANLGGKGVPPSAPTDEAKSASRASQTIGAIPISLALSELTTWACRTVIFGGLLQSKRLL